MRKRKRRPPPKRSLSPPLGTVQIDVGSWSSGQEVENSIEVSGNVESFAAPEQSADPVRLGGPAGDSTLQLPHIPQRAGYDCGLTSTAMAACITYEEARHFDPRTYPLPPNRGLYAREMITLLEAATGEKWRVGFAGKKDCHIYEYRPPDGVDRGVMLTKWKPKDTESHWVAFEVDAAGDVWIHDPLQMQPHRASEDSRYVRKLVLPRTK